MKFFKKQTNNLIVQAVVLFLGGCAFVFPSTGWCRTDTVKQVKQPVEQSVQIRRETQKQRDQWEQEKSKLALLYEQLKQEHEMLVSENKDLITTQKSQKKLNQTLLKQQQESSKIQKELFPFLKEVYAQLSTLVANDPPFLKEERAVRLKTLEQVIHDPEVCIAEKYRKVMEALFIEAEYGATIEVYQDKVLIGTEEVLGNIFRLGRVSLFFLSLDKQSSGYFNVAQKSWLPLADDHLPAIRSAVEIGNKRRTVELLPLPLGQLAIQGDE
ncbi:DUF3450 domain-containing protein [Desulfobacula toluolica]|uniref:Conserved uncharacterized protein n=1 Tax=Desulfobacula toluolica (strain DSM 7467 / Tol2) TaxID=651182 RepID=K0NRK8_DESTT|nr:DUF3450 domain-containing protein [Desulfobacula toluolica]CCK81582.1 conserved uncharacterized protein [Desulfobacula toluolica Tol2]